MSSEAKTVTVTRDQVSAARALVALRGGPQNVDPVIAKIAAATPRSQLDQGSKAS